ncbi:MAG: bifunctional (p)ppGpp synthetase/guanosine-3',5'-bis(diphosphate) 3'-pyrophosphohydrolase, partial [Clostridia bacterium]|nr:bifunctional (p)ppGpp synthetase/guanosine-3',5'-bis(diphosphate) 3'-pyrophosphohydrolase [Clostridia bacterium]
HAAWKPLPGRIKDYIAVPKPNMYQSLHTTVITNLGSPFEIQIRTKEMHKVAEYGIAAHWKYKEGAFEKGVSDKINWIKEVVENDAEHKDSKEFLASIKQDISLGNEVFVFTPKGAVKICRLVQLHLILLMPFTVRLVTNVWAQK